jgi:putative CocE/NonD family hydrolase
LSLNPPEDEPTDHFVYDPEVPVLAPGGMIPAWGPVDLSAQQQGNNLIIFDSEPIEDATTFVGEPALDLHVDSSVDATAFVARISWLRPDGSARFISLAAATFDAAERDDASGAVRLRLNFDPIALTLSKGDALRLDLASSAFPLLARHPNTRTPAEKIANPSHFRRARQTVFHDHIRSSSLKMPRASSPAHGKSS